MNLGSLIIFVGFAAAIAYVPLQVYTLMSWRGPWRIAALLPTLGMVPIIGITVIALAQESNLWPLLLIFMSPIASLYLFGLVVLKAILSQNGKDTPNAEDV
jgi:hypothetical protein